MPLRNITFNNQFNRTAYNDTLSSIGVSSNGSVFCLGISGGLEGIVVYNSNTNNLTAYNTTNGLLDNQMSVSSILRATVSGHDWFFIGTLTGGIVIFDASDSTFINFAALEGDKLKTETAYSSVEAMLYDSGTLFVGTHNNGVFGFDVSSSEITEREDLRITTDDGLPTLSIHSLAIDGSQLYVGTQNGLVKYDLEEQESWSTYILDESDDMPDNPVMSLVVVDAGSTTQAKLIAGTEQGGVAVISINYELSDREISISNQPGLDADAAMWTILAGMIGIIGTILGCKCLTDRNN